jgi:DNA-binding CsgD family transcriptional regulator
MDGAQHDDEVRTSIDKWREHRKQAQDFEQKAGESPNVYASSAFHHIRGTRRHLRRLLRKRFGVKVRYFGFRSQQHIASRDRFPYYPPRSPRDYYEYVQFSVFSNLLRVHDVLWAAMHSAYIRAHRNGEDPNVAALSALFRVLGSGPGAATPTNRSEPDDVLRKMSAITVAGWVGSHISLDKHHRVREALSENTDGSPGANFAKLVEELVPTTILAWDELQPGEPLRPGSGKTNLVSRVERLLQKIGSEAAEKQKAHLQFDDVAEHSQSDQLLEEFERMEETLRQLEQTTQLTRLEVAVWQRARDGLENAEIAGELKISNNSVSVHKSNAVKKLREARRAAGL